MVRSGFTSEAGLTVYCIDADLDTGSEVDFSQFFGDWEQHLTGDSSRIDLVAFGPPTDFHACPGTLGLASEHLWNRLAPWSGTRIRARPAFVNGERFFILLHGDHLDALDHSSTDFEPDPRDPKGFLFVNRFGFRREAIPHEPTVFTVPEALGWLLCNEAVATDLMNSGFLGVDIQPTP